MITERDDRFTRTVLSVVKKGSSRPITALDSDGKTVFIKLTGGLSSPSAAMSDMVCREIGHAIGLPILKPSLILLDERVDSSNVDVEIRDLLRKSYGLNLTTDFYPEAFDIVLDEGEVNTPMRDRLFIFDLFLLNVDRSLSNSNLLRVGTCEYSIDYEASFMIMGALQAKEYMQAESVRRALRQNPLYHPHLTYECFAKEFAALVEVDIESIIDGVPDSWLNYSTTTVSETKSQLVKSITQHINNKQQYIALYKQLESIDFIPESERKRKNIENRNLFTAKYSL